MGRISGVPVNRLPNQKHRSSRSQQTHLGPQQTPRDSAQTGLRADS